MKKQLIILLLCFVLVGCNNYDRMQNNYELYMNNLTSINTSSKYIPCNIEIDYEKITDDEVSYQIIIDNPKENMSNINVVVSHNMDTNDGYPSIGVFDDEAINLLIERDEDNSNKGIVLVGYFKYSGDIEELDTEFKVSISYINEAIEEKMIYFIHSI